MGKVLVKAKAMMDTSGNMQFLYGGEKGTDKGSMLARVLGGAGKFAGGALGATGPHRSLQSLVGGMQGGAAMGEQAGRWMGGISDLAPGGRARMAQRKIREETKDADAQKLAEQREYDRFRDKKGNLVSHKDQRAQSGWRGWGARQKGRLGAAQDTLSRTRGIGRFIPTSERTKTIEREKALGREAALAQRQKDAEMMRQMKLRHDYRQELNRQDETPIDAATGELAERMGVGEAHARRAGNIRAEGSTDMPLEQALSVLQPSNVTEGISAEHSTAGKPMFPTAPPQTVPTAGLVLGAGDNIPPGAGDHEAGVGPPSPDDSPTPPQNVSQRVSGTPVGGGNANVIPRWQAMFGPDSPQTPDSPEMPAV